MNKFKDRLIELGACKEALEWLGNRTAKEALKDCIRPDWLAWWFYRERETKGYPNEKELIKINLEYLNQCSKFTNYYKRDLELLDNYINNKISKDELKSSGGGFVVGSYFFCNYASLMGFGSLVDNKIKEESLEILLQIQKKYLYLPEEN